MEDLDQGKITEPEFSLNSQEVSLTVFRFHQKTALFYDIIVLLL